MTILIPDFIEIQEAIIEQKKLRGTRNHHTLEKDTITGQKFFLNTQRKERIFYPLLQEDGSPPPIEVCPFCNINSSKTIAYLKDGSVLNREECSESPEEWDCRIILNTYPTIVNPKSLADCFIIIVNPKYHSDTVDRLPSKILKCVYTGWSLLEQWALQNNLIAIPFINEGKSRLSGQSVYCFHSQVYCIDTCEVPDLYRKISLSDHCPICQLIVNQSYIISKTDTAVLLVNPFPKHNYSLLLFPFSHSNHLDTVSNDDFATLFSTAMKCYINRFGHIPAFNLGVRTGAENMHTHMEIIPKSDTNIIAGFEETTGMSILTIHPENVTQEFKNILLNM